MCIRDSLATSEPQNITVQDELRTFLGLEIHLVVASNREITQRLEQHYDSDRDSIEKIVQDLEEDFDLKQQAELLAGDGPIDLTGAEALADSAPVRKLLNMVLLLAIKDHASDIHFLSLIHI